MIGQFRSNGVGRRTAAALAAMFLTVSCHHPPGSGSCDLIVRVGEGPGDSAARGAVFDPLPPLTGLSTYLSGRGPGEQGFEGILLTSETVELSLAAGAWVLSASMVDAEGRTLLYGKTEVFLVPGPTRSVRILCVPLSGPGGLKIEYPSLPDIGTAYEFNCTLSDPKDREVRTWTDAVGIGSRSVEDLEAGYYLLGSRIVSAQGLLGSSTDVVRVLSGRTTEVVPSAHPGVALVSAEVGVDTEPPVPVSARLNSRTIRRGVPACFTAEGQDASFAWYVSGKVLARGSRVWLPTRDLPAFCRVEIIAASGDGRLGAAELQVEVIEGASSGPWLYYHTLTESEEPEASALASPAAIAAEASGETAVLLSDSSASRLDLWRCGRENLEPSLETSASIKIAGATRRATILAYSLDGTWAAAANGDSDWIWLVPVQHDAGSSTFGPPAEIRSSLPGLEGFKYIRGMAFSPDSRRLYALSNQDRALYVFLREGSEWSFINRTSLDDFPCGVLSSYRALAVSPDGGLLAVAAAGSDAVAIFGTTPSGLEWKGLVSGMQHGLDYPQALAFCPDGPYLGVANRDSGLTVIDCGPEPSVIALRGAEAGIPGAPRGICWTGIPVFPNEEPAPAGVVSDGTRMSILAVAYQGGISLFEASITDGFDISHVGRTFDSIDIGLSEEVACTGALGGFILAAGPSPGALALIARVGF